MSYKLIKTGIKEIKIIEPSIFTDKRGYFFESFNLRILQNLLDFEYNFVQDNHSRSKKNVLRGLHFQKTKPQGKLVKVIKGEIFDVAVDLRKNSKTFTNWTGHYLSSSNKHQIWIPPGFAHGFYVLSDFAEVFYKTTEYRDSNDEYCLSWNDPTFNIKWPTKNMPILSEKDRNAKLFSEISSDLE